MEGANGAGVSDRPAELLPFAWAPGWNSPQAWNKFQAEVGGAMRGGDSGKFVIISDTKPVTYFSTAPTAYKAGKDFRLVPLHHIFGSEEQSARCKPIAERTPAAYVAVNEEDAKRLGLNGKASVEIDGQKLTLPVKRTALASGVIGLPEGLSGVPFLSQPSGSLSKAS
jgi:NADH-quinone oxidoreductase subunit G